MKIDKNPLIDTLRAFSILVVLITHSLVPFLGPSHINILWNYLHFSVIAFVFCSGYGTIASYARYVKTNTSTFWWMLKRFSRLYVPFALYILGYWVLTYLFPHIFTGQDFQPTRSFITSSLTLFGGASMGWLPVLFLELTLLTPVYLYVLQNQKRMVAAFFLLFFLSFLQGVFPLPSTSSRFTAWIFWSIPYLAGGASGHIQFSKPKTKRALAFLGISFLVLHAVLSLFISSNRLPLTLTSHKYPPDLFYFSYGFGVNAFLLILFSFISFHHQITAIIRFLARHSYSLLFVHWIVLDGTQSHFPHSSAPFAVLFSILVALSITWIFSRISNQKTN